MKVKSKKIAYYSGGFNNKNIEPTDLDTFLSDIKTGRWQDPVLNLRTALTDKKEGIKDALPFVTLSGIFTERTDATLQTHSTYIGIDVDHQPQLSQTAPELRDLLIKDPMVYAVFLSCGGNGLCAVVKVDPKAHREAYSWMSLHFYKRYNINTDPSCKNLARLRFVSYDPDLVINTAALVCPATPAPKSAKKEVKKFQHFDEEFERIIDEITAKQIDLTKTYNDWLYCGLAIISKYEEQPARAYFHCISEIHPDYDYDKTDQKFDNLLTSTRGEVPIDWFYNHIEKKGLKAYSKDTEAKMVFNIISAPESDDTEDPAQPVIDKDIARRVLDEMPLVTKIKYFLKSKHTEYIHNEFTDELTAGDNPVTDRLLNSFYVECREKIDDKTQFDLVRRILQSDFTKTFHPFKDFITHCQNDYTTEQARGHVDKIISALTSETQYADLFIKKWLVAMVASAFGNMSELVLVFCGPQGTGKTEWFRRILPAVLSRYRATLNWSGDKDEIIRMSRNLIMLDDEMGGKSQREEKQIKKVSSIDKEQQRAAYKAIDEMFKRHAIFCGTTNDEWILSDPSGNRRFLPFYISAMNHALFNAVDKELLFYELYLEWQAGYPITLSVEDKKKLDQISSRFEKPHLEEELIGRFLSLPEENKPGEYLTATDLMMYVKGQAPGMMIKIEKLGAALQKAGFQRRQKRVTGQLRWVYHVVKQSDFTETNDDIL